MKRLRNLKQFKGFLGQKESEIGDFATKNPINSYN